MTQNIRYVRLDVHAATIAVAVTEGRGEVRSLGQISNTPEAVAKLVKKLGAPASLHACYEAGRTGYTLYWQLTKLGVHCEVIAPSLIPVKCGDRVKTDRRDAEKLARLFRAGDLTSVFVPSAEHEALRDLVRAREAAKTDQLRARHRLSKYLLRYGKVPPAGCRAWTLTYWRWVRVLKLDHAAQEQTLLDYIHEVEHQGERNARLDKAIDEALETAPASMSARSRKENARLRYVVPTHEPSERPLPTNHEHEAGFARPSNISVINRRRFLFDPWLLRLVIRQKGRT